MSQLYQQNNPQPCQLFSGEDRSQEIGLIAQEVEAVLPEIVYTDEEGHKLINYDALIPVLIESVKSLSSQVEDLKREVNYLQSLH